MRHGWMLAVTALAAAFWPAALCAQMKGEVVAGVVVSATDRHPLAHAVVGLTEIGTERAAAKTTTGEDGRFRFNPIAAGKYRLTAAAPRFLPGSYLEHGVYSTAIVTGAGLATDGLELRLTPEASISGRIVDEDGDPLEGAAVRLYRESPQQVERVTLFRVSGTKQDGVYEFVGLPAGRYFVTAQATPWYALHPQPEPPRGRPPYRASVDPSLDMAYPTLFFPDGTDERSASPLNLQGGEQLTADMQMHPQTAVTLTLKLPSDEKRKQVYPRLSRSLFGVEEQVDGQMQFSDGEQKITGVAPGQYMLYVQAQGGAQSSSSRAVDLSTGSIVVDAPTLEEAATAKVTVHSVDGKALTEPAQLILRGPDSHRPISAILESKGPTELTNIAPGEYSFLLNGERRMDVVRVMVDGKPVANKRLRVSAPSTLTVDLTVSVVSVKMEGVVRREGKVVAGSMVVLVPAGGDLNPDLFRRDQSDLDGSFNLLDVAPGKYILVAIDDGWSLTPEDVEALAPYLLHGIPISIGETALSVIKLTEPLAAQKRIERR